MKEFDMERLIVGMIISFFCALIVGSIFDTDYFILFGAAMMGYYFKEIKNIVKKLFTKS